MKTWTGVPCTNRVWISPKDYHLTACLDLFHLWHHCPSAQSVFLILGENQIYLSSKIVHSNCFSPVPRLLPHSGDHRFSIISPISFSLLVLISHAFFSGRRMIFLNWLSFSFLKIGKKFFTAFGLRPKQLNTTWRVPSEQPTIISQAMIISATPALIMLCYLWFLKQS